MSRLLHLVRIGVGVGLIAWAIATLLEAWVRALAVPLVGVTPWGESTGLRVSPLGPDDLAAANALERRLAGRWAEGLDSRS